jgi:hypothetical protein
MGVSVNKALCSRLSRPGLKSCFARRPFNLNVVRACNEIIKFLVAVQGRPSAVGFGADTERPGEDLGIKIV